MFAAIVSVGGLAVFAIDYSQDTNTSLKSMSLPLADAIMQGTCTMTFDEAKREAGFSHKSPQTLPNNYSLVDSYSHRGIMTMLYSDTPLCGENGVAQNYHDGLLKFIVSTPEQSEYVISSGKTYFEEFKTNSDYPERISIFEINGKPTMAWESGMKKSITLYDDGTIVDIEPIPYPAQIQIVDPVDQKYYILKGYFPVAQLKQIAQSLG